MSARILVGLVLLTGLSTLVAPAAERPANVVFILADDLGYTDVACFGSKYYETPNIDRMAEQGMRFTNGYTCGPNCQPTRAALMSGQYGPRTGVYTVGGIERFNWQSRPLRPVDNVQQLPLQIPTIAQTLKSAGYATGMFGKWHLGQAGEYHPSQRGFDEAIVSMGQHFNFVTTPRVEYPEGTYLADFLTNKAVDFIQRHRDQSFFLYLPHFGVHAPHEAKADLIARFKNKPAAGGHDDPTYAAMIASVDESVGRVLKKLDELQLSQNTLVIFASDNGGVGGYDREGLNRAGGITDNAPLRGGKGMLYEGGVRVPYVFRWPGRIAPKTVCNEPINSVDLYPTLLEVTGAKLPANHRLDGTSYVNLLDNGGKPSGTRPPLYWHFPGYLGAGEGTWRTTPAGSIRSGVWKLIEFFEDNRLELYNLHDDLSEKNNLAASMPDKVRELHSQLVEWRKSVNAPMPTKNDSVTSNSAKNDTGKTGKTGKAGKGKKKKAKQDE